MFIGITFATCLALSVPQADERPPRQSEPAASQPATAPASQPAPGGRGTLRRPGDDEILRNLLQEKERGTPILPQQPDKAPGKGKAKGGEPGVGADGFPLLLEGTHLIERPGRLVREGGKPRFMFHVPGGAQAPQSMEILPNQLLEAMERESEAGFADFIISGEVTRYRDRNYLILRKILRRVANGNIGP